MGADVEMKDEGAQKKKEEAAANAEEETKPPPKELDVLEMVLKSLPRPALLVDSRFPKGVCVRGVPDRARAV